MAELLDLRGVNISRVLNAQVRREVSAPGFRPVRAVGLIFRFWVSYRVLGEGFGPLRHVELAAKDGGAPVRVAIRWHGDCGGLHREHGRWRPCHCDEALAEHDAATCEVCA